VGMRGDILASTEVHDKITSSATGPVTADLVEPKFTTLRLHVTYQKVC
jgi:hypothetical protein